MRLPATPLRLPTLALAAVVHVLPAAACDAVINCSDQPWQVAVGAGSTGKLVVQRQGRAGETLQAGSDELPIAAGTHALLSCSAAAAGGDYEINLVLRRGGDVADRKDSGAGQPRLVLVARRGEPLRFLEPSAEHAKLVDIERLPGFILIHSGPKAPAKAAPRAAVDADAFWAANGRAYNSTETDWAVKLLEGSKGTVTFHNYGQNGPYPSLPRDGQVILPARTAYPMAFAPAEAGGDFLVRMVLHDPSKPDRVVRVDARPGVLAFPDDSASAAPVPVELCTSFMDIFLGGMAKAYAESGVPLPDAAAEPVPAGGKVESKRTATPKG